MSDEEKSASTELTKAYGRNPERPSAISGADLRGIEPPPGLVHGEFHGCRFDDATIRTSPAGPSPCEFVDSVLKDGTFHGLTIRGTGNDARGATFIRCIFRNVGAGDYEGAKFIGCSFHDAKFTEASLKSCTFVDPGFTERTKFKNMGSLEGCTIDRFALEFLGDDYGGLTLGQRAVMNIEDGLAELRAAYSGFWQWVHIAALVAFLAPYVAFIVMNWARAAPECTAERCTTLWTALLQFIMTGGAFDGHVAWGPVLAFGFSLAYNLQRAVLLAKTKSLELKVQASGIPVRFSLRDSWIGFLFEASKWGFRINLAVVLYHSWHFLQLQIPDPSM